jgi:hypothetical protein
MLFRTLLSLCLFALPSFAGPLDFLQHRPGLSQKQLEKLVKKWTRQLRLTDWDIDVDSVALSELPEGSAGAAAWSNALHHGIVHTLKAEEYALLAQKDGTPPMTRGQVKRDIQDTVIHELVHLRLKALMEAPNEKLNVAEEYTVVRLTQALLKK